MGKWRPLVRCPWHSAGLVLLAAGLVALGACNTSHPNTAPATVITTTIAPAAITTIPAATTTTLYQPSAPQSSREAAANHLIATWHVGDRAGALTGASPAAVGEVFAQPYPKGGAQARGCSQAVAGPSFCDFRVDNGLLDLAVVAVAGGWSVDRATFMS